MKKILLIASLMASLFLMSACDSMEGPSPLDTAAAGGDASALGGDDMSDGSLNGNGGNLSDGLNERASDSAMGFDPENINPEDIVGTIYFGFNQYAVAPSERENVRKAAEFFKSNPNMKVYLVGHTDWYGTEEYNMLLSDRRCKAVQEYMLGAGLDAAKVETIARGEQGAVVDVAKNSPEAKHDRRVDIVKVK